MSDYGIVNSVNLTLNFSFLKPVISKWKTLIEEIMIIDTIVSED